MCLMYVVLVAVVIVTRNRLCESLERYRDSSGASVPSALSRRGHCLRLRRHGMNTLGIHRELQ